MLETLKFICIAGIPAGRRLAGLTCSGGGATMLADHGERLQLSFPQPTHECAADLRSLLPHTATVSNPLDYTTPIWGFPDKVTPVFHKMFEDNYDAAAIVQDYPLAGLDADKQSYLNDAGSFVTATSSAGLPAAVISTLPENLDESTRIMLVSSGVAPLQGLPEAVTAIASAAWCGERHSAIRQQVPQLLKVHPLEGMPALIDEWQAKQLLQTAGIATPEGKLVSAAEVSAVAQELGFPVVLKMASPRLAHKTEAGAVALGLMTATDVEDAAQRMTEAVRCYDPDAVTDRFIVEKMAPRPVAELLVSVRHDAQFGHAMTIASGGILVEVVGDAATVLLPATRNELDAALSGLKVNSLLTGARGQQGADRNRLIDTLEALARFAGEHAGSIAEVEINPLFVSSDSVVAVDALIRSV